MIVYPTPRDTWWHDVAEHRACPFVPVNNGRLVKLGYGVGAGEAHWVDEGL
jgi:hypothetical protein